MTRWTEFQFTFVHLWHFCPRVWRSCVSNKQWPLKAGYHAVHTPRSHLQHMNCCSTPTTYYHHFRHSIFSRWAFFLFIYPIVFPPCPSCPYNSLKETKLWQHSKHNTLLNFCSTALEKLFLLWIVILGWTSVSKCCHKLCVSAHSQTTGAPQCQWCFLA